MEYTGEYLTSTNSVVIFNNDQNDSVEPVKMELHDEGLRSMIQESSVEDVGEDIKFLIKTEEEDNMCTDETPFLNELKDNVSFDGNDQVHLLTNDTPKKKRRYRKKKTSREVRAKSCAYIETDKIRAKTRSIQRKSVFAQAYQLVRQCGGQILIVYADDKENSVTYTSSDYIWERLIGSGLSLPEILRGKVERVEMVCGPSVDKVKERKHVVMKPKPKKRNRVIKRSQNTGSTTNKTFEEQYFEAVRSNPDITISPVTGISKDYQAELSGDYPRSEMMCGSFEDEQTQRNNFSFQENQTSTCPAEEVSRNIGISQNPDCAEELSSQNNALHPCHTEVTSSQILCNETDYEQKDENLSAVVMENEKEPVTFANIQHEVSLSNFETPQKDVLEKGITDSLGSADNVHVANGFEKSCLEQQKVTSEKKLKSGKCRREKVQYSCKICGTCFLWKTHLRKHEKIHKTFKCRICKESFSSALKRRSHMAEHRKTFKCVECGDKTFENDLQYEQHMNLHVFPEKMMCYKCLEPFENQETYDRHMKNLSEQPHHCSICKKHFCSKEKLLAHRTIHKRQRKSSLSREFERITDENKTKIHCEICGIKFANSSNLRKHNTDLHGLRPFTCVLCEKNFTSRSELNDHNTIHKEANRWKCNICDKTLKTLHILRQHLARHNATNQFLCMVCGKSSHTIDDLRSHESTHVVKDPVQCKICGKTLKSNSILKKHLQIHSDKKYPCLVCGKILNNSNSLYKHKMTHFGANKYFPCTICGKKFISGHRLKLHGVVHTGDKPYKCSICGGGYTQRHYVKLHMKTQHGIVKE